VTLTVTRQPRVLITAAFGQGQPAVSPTATALEIVAGCDLTMEGMAPTQEDVKCERMKALGLLQVVRGLAFRRSAPRGGPPGEVSGADRAGRKHLPGLGSSLVESGLGT